MSRGVNKVILLGRLGQDPEARYTPSGTAVTSCSLATSESWKDRSSGETQNRTEWHNLVFFNRLAEVAAQYLRKGSQIYIEGSLRTNRYTDRNNIERFRTEIIVSEMQMLGKPSDGAGGFSPQPEGNFGGQSGGYAQQSNQNFAANNMGQNPQQNQPWQNSNPPSTGGGYNNTPAQQPSEPQATPQNNRPFQSPQPAQNQGASQKSDNFGFDDFDDDIPF